MPKLNLNDLDQSRKPREEAEAEALTAVYDGRRRYKSGKTRAMIFRTTEEKRAQILRIADALSTADRVVSITMVIEMSIDALEEKLKGGAA